MSNPVSTNPLGYAGVLPNNPPNQIAAERDPLPTDLNANPGDEWMNRAAVPFSFYKQSGFLNGQALWEEFVGVSSGITTINNILPDSAGNFTLITGEGISITPSTNAVAIATNFATADTATGALTFYDPFTKTTFFSYLSPNVQAVFSVATLLNSFSVAGQLTQIGVDNLSSAASSSARIIITTQNGAGDTYLMFNPHEGGSANFFQVGQTQANVFQITASTSSTAPYVMSGTTILQGDTLGNLTVPVGSLSVGTKLADVGGTVYLSTSFSKSGANVVTQTSNTSGTAGSNAAFAANVVASGGDAWYNANQTGSSTLSYNWGLHAADGSWRLTQGTSGLTSTLFMNSSSAGAITKPFQPCFLVVLTTSTAGNDTGDGTAYNLGNGNSGVCTTVFDQGTNVTYPANVCTFTAPVTGKYFFRVRFYLNTISALHTSSSATIIAGSRTFQGGLFNIGAVRDVNNEAGLNTVTCEADLTASQTVTCQVSASGVGATKTIGITGAVATTPFTYFEGFLIC